MVIVFHYIISKKVSIMFKLNVEMIEIFFFTN